MLLAAAVVKACALLTAAEVAAVHGDNPAKVRRSVPRHDARRCFFALPAGKSVALQVTLGPEAASLSERLRVAAEVEGEEAGDHDEPAVEPVSGLGDEAFWAGPLAGLYVRRGETVLRLDISGEDSKEAKLTKLRPLATKALSRLPK